MGFKLRSGNGPLAFKNMGSSPVYKRGEDMVKIDPIQTKEIKQTKLSPPDKLEKAVKPQNNIKEAVTLQEKKDNLKSVKKDNRSDKKELRKEQRAEKKAYKEANKGTEGYKENKKTLKSVQKDERKALRTNRKADKKEARDAVKSDPEYIAKKEKRAQAFRDAGEIVSNIGDKDTSMSSVIQGQADRKTNKVNKDIQNEKDRVNTARTQQLVDATNKAGTEEEKVSSTKSEAVTNGGNANVTVKTSNNRGSVTTSKTLAKK